jgi:predicted membrane protein
MKLQGLIKPENEKEKQQQQLLIILLIMTGYYLVIYLPQEKERKKKQFEQERLNNEKMKAKEIEKNKLKETREQTINDLKATCEKHELNKTIIEGFIREIKQAVAINQISTLKAKALEVIKEEIIKKKKFH